MKQKTSRILYNYWNDLRGRRLAPYRFEIEPGRIADILSETFILERLEGGHYRYRLAGTRICSDFGYELRGSSFLEGWSEADKGVLERLLAPVTRQCAVAVVTFQAAGRSGRVSHFELLLLPLLHTGQTVDRLLGSMTAIDRPPWLGDERVVTRRVLARETLWPDGELSAQQEKVHRQPPFLPHVRNARIVKADRRQFRVYEGGLGKPPPEES